jgi:thiol-disulfide isomerase/thioredoxin
MSNLYINLTFIAAVLFVNFSLLSQARLNDFKFQSPGIIDMQAGGTEEFQVSIQLPKENHIYVDHVNSLSFNILTSFEVDEKSGFLLEYKSKPKSIQKGNDMILPGQGRGKDAGVYSLLLSETQGRKKASKLHNVTVNIKTQVCDTNKDECFAPQNFKKTLRVRINQDRVTKSSRALSADNVNWFTDEAKAREAAIARGQNVLVLFTASWCGPCVRFSQNVFAQREASDYLNKNFVALKFEHGVADQSVFNKFKIRSYPTVYVADTNMKELSRSISRHEATAFVNSISRYGHPYSGGSVTTTTVSNTSSTSGGSNENTSSGTNTSSTTTTATPTPVQVSSPVPIANNPVLSWNLSITEKSQTGNLVLLADGSWEYRIHNSTQYKFQENRRDENYIILLNTNSNEWLAVPIQGKGGVLVYRNDAWADYGRVE